MNNLILILMGMVVIQSLLFAIYLFRNAVKDRKSRILQVLILVIALHFCNLIFGKVLPDYPGYGLSWMFLSVYGPLIFIYTKCFVNPKATVDYLHLTIPAYPLFLWVFTTRLHRESSVDMYFDYWVSLPIYGSFLVYLIISLSIIYAANQNLANLKWLKYLVLSFSILVLQHLVVLFTFSKGQGSLGTALYIAEIVYMLFFVSGMVFTALSRPVIFADVKRILESIPRSPKYYYANLTNQESRHILEQLEKFMGEESPYLDPNLSLVGVSESIGVPKRYISQVINENLNINFKEYINAYRIRRAVDILEQPNNDIRIFEVMYDVGFNSRSSFNQTFKKFTGQTPSDFRSSVLQKHGDNPYITE
ncbi:helix-turn-helix domain-containing protein [Flagellimonas flava]|uniref:helix-turn-helix domain-containing protein n=1 Tax=Flagellimonas flava TaxID=570519 RepID=UPI003D6574A2